MRTKLIESSSFSTLAANVSNYISPLMLNNDNNMGYMEIVSKVVFGGVISLRAYRNRIRATRLSAFLIESRTYVEDIYNNI